MAHPMDGVVDSLKLEVRNLEVLESGGPRIRRFGNQEVQEFGGLEARMESLREALAAQRGGLCEGDSLS